MRRPYVIGLIGFAVVVFLVVSALLARAFSVGGAEDAALTDLVTAEAHGNTAAVTRMIIGCQAHPACRARAASVSASLRRPGGISIVQIQESAGFSLGSTLGTARIVWLAGSSLPRVQCMIVRHTGDVLSGFAVRIEKVSPRIASDASCPAHF
jgi:hypothetical protein